MDVIQTMDVIYLTIKHMAKTQVSCKSATNPMTFKYGFYINSANFHAYCWSHHPQLLKREWPPTDPPNSYFCLTLIIFKAAYKWIQERNVFWHKWLNSENHIQNYRFCIRNTKAKICSFCSKIHWSHSCLVILDFELWLMP